MPLWKLEPLDPSDQNWEASAFKDEVIVRAADSRIARLLAARAFGIATERRAGEAVKVVPWDYGRFVGCSRVEATENYSADGDQGIVYPAEAIDLAHYRYDRL